MPTTFKHENNRHDAFNVRASVFMVEQGFSYDFDILDDDDRVVHITAHDSENGEVLGCARIFPSDLEWQYPDFLDIADDIWVVGRIAVMKDARKSGLGSAILEESEHMARENGAREMHLHAQVRAMPFYKKLGYVEYGGQEDDEGVMHQWMRKSLPAAAQ